jgi:polyphosphate kinase
VAELKELMREDPNTQLDSGPVGEALRQVTRQAGALIARQYELLNRTLTPALAEQGIAIHLSSTWTDAQRAWAEQVFVEQIEPLLTPIALDPAHPFPRILNKSLNFVIELDGDDAFGRKADIAIVQAPRALPRVLRVPPDVSGAPHGVMLLTSVVGGFVDRLFPGLAVRSVNQFRVTRNSELFVDDEEITDLRQALRTELVQRHYGDEVRLEVSAGIGERVLRLLLSEFDLTAADCYRVDGPVNLVRLQQVIDLVDRPDLKFPPFEPGIPPPLRTRDLFAAIRAQDVLLHHPYESFAPVVEFVQQAARDPDVLAIKQTLYRTSGDSPVVRALIDASVAGKQVTALVELMARFDEANNIKWARELEEAGVHVVYGLMGHKTHCKCCLVVRREGTVLRRYLHLGTGNYNPKTARLYTDISLLTCREHLAAEVAQLFNTLTGLGRTPEFKHLLVAPFNLHSRTQELINAEAANAAAGRPARIIAKMNKLVDPVTIENLYAASQAGVKIDLIVRATCCLVPGVKGLSENIRLRNIVGRFLEHARIFYFENAGQPLVYCGSADWMSRNFFRRVEAVFPVEEPELRRRLIEDLLPIELRDNEDARELQPDGSYTPVVRAPGQETFRAQKYFMAAAGLRAGATGSVAPMAAVTPPPAS